MASYFFAKKSFFLVFFLKKSFFYWKWRFGEPNWRAVGEKRSIDRPHGLSSVFPWCQFWVCTIIQLRWKQCTTTFCATLITETPGIICQNALLILSWGTNMDRTMCNQPVPLLRGGAVIFIHGFSLIAADCRRVQKKIGVVTQSQLDKHQSLHLCTYAL